MSRDAAIRILRSFEDELKRLGFGRLYLFGSTARDEPKPKDVDLLFEWAPSATPNFSSLAGAEIQLEEAFGRPVELVDRERLHRRIRARVEAEMIEIYR